MKLTRSTRKSALRLTPLLLCALALLPAEGAGAAESRFLCSADEKVVFGCTLPNKKQVSVCTAPRLTVSEGYLQYRYGTPAKIELEYPAQRVPPKGLFHFGSTGFSGGGASELHFKIGEYDYFVYDSTVRTNFKAGEPNNPAFSAGVVTRLKGKRLSAQRCTNDASLGQVLYEQIEKEEFDDDVLP
jgi:hypothetical protein